MKKPIKKEQLWVLVQNIKDNLKAFYDGESISTAYATLVMEQLTQFMKDGHVIEVSVWPMDKLTQVWYLNIDGVFIVKTYSFLL